MLGGLSQFQTARRAGVGGVHSRKAMLETLVRHLSMVRLTIASACLFMVVGCSGLIDGGGSGGLTPEQAAARKVWLEKALPQLQANCQVCHDGSRANIGFIEGTADFGRRDTLMAYSPAVVNLDAPGSSRLLTKGAHEGPPLDAIQTSDILEWIQAEHDAIPDDGVTGPTLETEKFIPQLCTGGLAGDPTCPINTVALDAIGDGVVGAKISFVVQALGSGLYVTNLKLIPGTGGAFIEHPLFVSWPADETLPPTFDKIDRFFAVKMNLMMTATPEEQQIGGGTAAFVGFNAGPMDKLTIHFKAAKLYQPDGGGGGGGGGGGATGCKKLDVFKTAAQGPLNTNCQSCHAGQNPNATSAMNITGVNGTDDALLQTACNQVRTRVNFQTIDQSGIFLATVPGNGNHPFTFNGNVGAHDAFKAALNPWIVAERDAP